MLYELKLRDTYYYTIKYKMTPDKWKNVTNIRDLGFKIKKIDENWFAIKIIKTDLKLFTEFSKYYKSLVCEQYLLDHQIEHTRKILKSLLYNGITLDTSDTGTGKTYITCAVLFETNSKALIICPKSIVNNWKEVAKHFGINNNIRVINYEKIRNGKTKYLDKAQKNLKLTLDKNTVIVFDEVHRCKNYGTLNSKLLLSAKNQNYKIMMLSATLCANPANFDVFGRVFGFYSADNGFFSWIKQFGVIDGIFNNKTENIIKLRNLIFPKYGSRISLKEIEELPERYIFANCYNTDKLDVVNKLYDEMIYIIRKIDEKKKYDKNMLAELMHLRQELEIIKVPIFVEQTKDLLNSGNSVIIFVNFVDTLKELYKKFPSAGIIDGSVKDKFSVAKDFRMNKFRLLICNIASASESLNLDDVDGKFPRVSLISIPWNSIQLIQILGRTYRACTKSKVIQKMIFIANSYEEIISMNIRKKIKNIELLNNSDLIKI